MANSGHLTPEEVDELVNRRNREKRQVVPHQMDMDDKAKKASPDIEEVNEPEVEGNDEKDTPLLSNLGKGVEIIYQKDEEKVTFVVDRFISSGGYAKTYLVNQKLMKYMKPMIIKEFCPRTAVRNKQNHLLFNIQDEEIKSALEDFKKEPQRIKELLELISKEEWERLNLVIPHTENTFTCFGNEYYVMEYVPGDSLTKLMEKKAEMVSPEDKLYILKELCVAVSNLHSIGCVHQDLSTNNVLVSKDEHGSVKLKVIDYGMCTTLKYREGQGYSVVRVGGTKGFWDFRNFGTYKKWSISNDEGLIKRLKLIDIYSLGAVLAYVYLLPSKHYLDEDNGFAALDELIAMNRCGAEQRVLLTDAPADEKVKTIYNMVRELAAAATHPDVVNNERIQTVDEFMERLQVIIDYLTPPSEKGELKVALQTLQNELEEVQKSREQKEKEYHRAMKAQIKEIEGQQRKLKELENSLKAKDEASKQRVQKLQVRLQEEQNRLKKELEQKEREKKHWEEELAKYERENNQAKGKEQELKQRIGLLSKQLESARLQNKDLMESSQKERIRYAEEMRLLRETMEKINSNVPTTLREPVMPWYKRYKQPVLIALVVIGMVGVAVGIGSIDWNSGDTQLKDSATELQVQSVGDASLSVQPAEADINVSHQLQPEQLTTLIQQARQDEKVKQYLLGELCAKDVMVWEEEGETTFEVPVLQLFGNIAGRYPVIGYTHKVKEVEYNRNGKINLIVLVRIK